MSLNGLDDAKVTEAYQGALAEAGGWFLLKYASRDAVEVLTRGTGGAGEARSAVVQYEEKSPLYGFLLYRRRKVLIKYVPEGTSRLLQARVTVHFSAVTEKFTPHDAVITIASADELSDSALTAACSLHTAAPSSCSSSGSSKRHKLDEITEDAEEGQTADDDITSAARPTTASSSKPIIIEPPGNTEAISLETQERPLTASSSITKSAEDSKSATEPSHDTVHTATSTAEENEQLKPTTANYRESLKTYDSLFENGPDPRMSSQTARPSYSELYAEIYAQYNKPKVKLGPRPKASLDVKRPHTSGSGTQSAARPVSTLPAGLRVANRKTAEPKRPKSRDSSVVPSIAFPPPPPVPSIPELPKSPTFPPKSPASVKSLPIGSYSSQGSKSGGMEKQRLMKALELRKKQMKARKEKEEKMVREKSENLDAAPHEAAKSKEASTSIALSTESGLERKATAEIIAESDTPERKENDSSAKTEEPAAEDSKLSTEDSGLESVGSPPEVDDHNSAASASSPTSAQTQGSSCAPSTRPSSISEDDHHLAEAVAKTKEGDDVASQDNERLASSSQNEDEKESVESSPTVVPESSTPVPSVEISAQVDQPAENTTQASSSEGTQLRRNRRESMILIPPGDDDSRSQRRSKRESMIFMPSSEISKSDESQNRRLKRESMILPPMKIPSSESTDKRRATVDPVLLHTSTENSDAEYLSDDSFMEELQSAKVEQAKPISVSKSPITPFFPRKSSVSEISIPERSVSQQYNKIGRLSPEQVGSRKSSGPWLPHASTDTVVVAKKINVSSGISQRIKALAEKSNRDSSASVSPVATPDASTSIVAQRKSSFFSTPPTGNSPPGKTVQRLSRASFANLPNSTTPDRKSVLQPPPINTDQTVYNVQQGTEKPESVQVTARIVRDARMEKPTLTMPNESTPLGLHQSPLIIDHQRSARPSSSKHSPSKVEPTSPRPPSSSHSREASSSALPRSSSESSWRSFGRRLSESRSGGAPSRSQSTHSFESCEEKRDEKKERKDSRTTKLFKRMSSISSISRKNNPVSPILHEEALLSTSLPSLREPPPPVQVGDLNIQFPDTLLWKRRWVEIDATGNLVLSLSKSNEQSKGITKRFHLSEFRTPYAPDQDRQELPNSVILDFIDGRTLQCACETFVAQAQVLQILREAHDAWLAYNQQ